MGYRDGFGTTRSVKKVYLWETGEEVGRSLPGRARGGRRGHHPLATNTPPSSSSPSPPSSSPSPPTTPPPCSYIYRTWTLPRECSYHCLQVPNCAALVGGLLYHVSHHCWSIFYLIHLLKRMNLKWQECSCMKWYELAPEKVIKKCMVEYIF